MDLKPRLLSETYVYSTMKTESAPDPLWIAALSPWGQFWEKEGLTLILEKPRALEYGLKPTVDVQAIVLDTQTTLNQVGITALVANALASEGIACNVIAGFYHDVFFVPMGCGQRALELISLL